jgi:hypothetical protein
MPFPRLRVSFPPLALGLKAAGYFLCSLFSIAEVGTDPHRAEGGIMLAL